MKVGVFLGWQDKPFGSLEVNEQIFAELERIGYINLIMESSFDDHQCQSPKCFRMFIKKDERVCLPS